MGKLKIYFLGSGDVAVPILEKLVGSGKIELAGIGTQNDRPSGRGRKLMPTPVGAFLEGRGIKADKPDSVNSADFISHLKGLSPDMVFVASFGQILKEEILGISSLGCINMHASLLPLYRGASPIVAAILNGDARTGVSLMRMEKGLDTGPVFSMHDTEILADETAPELELRLGRLAAAHVEETLLKIADGSLSPMPQDHSRSSYAGKVKKEDGLVDWNEDADLIARKIRAYHPWPAAYFNLGLQSGTRLVKINRARVVPGVGGIPGETIMTADQEWIVACGSGALSLLRVVPEGKGEMAGADFMRGIRRQLAPASQENAASSATNNI